MNDPRSIVRHAKQLQADQAAAGRRVSIASVVSGMRSATIGGGATEFDEQPPSVAAANQWLTTAQALRESITPGELRDAMRVLQDFGRDRFARALRQHLEAVAGGNNRAEIILPTPDSKRR